MTWVFVFQKRKEKKTTHLKPTYLWNYLIKMKQKIKTIWKYNNKKEMDEIITKEVYFLIILFLKSTFDSFYFIKSIFNKIE